MRGKPWQLGAVLAAICGIAIGVLEWRSNHDTHDPSRLLNLLPLNGAVKVYVDVATLRAGGVLDQLAGKNASEDPDYRAFAQQIGFEYRTDLDAMAVAFLNHSVYAAVRGRFDWKKLSDYALAQKGQCTKEVCSVPVDDSGRPASEPNRIISFDLLSPDVLAWAVSFEPLAVAKIGYGKNSGLEGTPVPAASVLWISAPGSAFRDAENTPSGTRAFLSPLAATEDAAFSLQPAAAGLNKDKRDKFEIHMDATCSSPETATALAGVLTKTTDVLRTMFAQDKTAPDAASLSAVLISGRFEPQAAKVSGTWPIDKRVIDSLLAETK